MNKATVVYLDVVVDVKLAQGYVENGSQFYWSIGHVSTYIIGKWSMTWQFLYIISILLNNLI